MEQRRIIRTDIAASAIAHLTLVALIIFISEVRPFHTPPTETVTVDIVTPEQLKEAAPEPAPAPKLPAPDAPAMTKAEAPNTPPEPSPPSPAASQPPQQPQQQQQKQPPPAPNAREAKAPTQAQSAPPPPSYKPPEPDVTVKYGVMLGLPDAPLLPTDSPKEESGGDARDSVAATLPGDVIAEFRRHLKSCAKLPDAIAPSDNVRVKLRAVMTSDGMLAGAPVLVEASASAKGPILMRSAKSALEACQPYKMLPADKYEEWKVLDLTFTPKDFNAS